MTGCGSGPPQGASNEPLGPGTCELLNRSTREPKEFPACRSFDNSDGPECNTAPVPSGAEDRHPKGRIRRGSRPACQTGQQSLSCATPLVRLSVLSAHAIPLDPATGHSGEVPTDGHACEWVILQSDSKIIRAADSAVTARRYSSRGHCRLASNGAGARPWPCWWDVVAHGRSISLTPHS